MRWEKKKKKRCRFVRSSKNYSQYRTGQGSIVQYSATRSLVCLFVVTPLLLTGVPRRLSTLRGRSYAVALVSQVVHGDLKPANFVFVRGSLKLIDFGIAKAISNDTTNISRDSRVSVLNEYPTPLPLTHAMVAARYFGSVHTAGTKLY